MVDVPADMDERRLWALEALCDPLTISMLTSIGFSRRSRCLEVGAGRGSIARWLATQCVHGSVTAIDTDLRWLNEPRLPNLHVRWCDVVDGPVFPPGAFDLIHVRAVLVHLPDRQDVLLRLAEWLAPGGWLVIEEPTLFPVDSLLDADLQQAIKAFERLMTDRLGTDFSWPRRLPAALRSAGLTRTAMTAALAVTSDAGASNEFWRACLIQAADELVGGSLLDPMTLQSALTVLADPTYQDLIMAFVCARGQAAEQVDR